MHKKTPFRVACHFREPEHVFSQIVDISIWILYQYVDNDRKVFFSAYYFILFDDATADAKRTRFLRVDHSRKLQIALLFRQAGIIVFLLSNIVYCNKLRTNEPYNSQKHSNSHYLRTKMIDF